MQKQHNLIWARKVLVVVGILTASLVAMSFCHLVDVQEKVDEGVMYMAYIFYAHIALTVLLAVIAIVSTVYGSLDWLRRTSRVAVLLSVVTVAGFIWSRMLGLPQMEDHVGKWDSLGLVSVVFALTVIVAGSWLVHSFQKAEIKRFLPVGRVGSMMVLGVLIAASSASAAMSPMPMHVGNMDEYPRFDDKSNSDQLRAWKLHYRTKKYAVRFNTIRKASARGYRLDKKEGRKLGRPALRHMRIGGVRFTGKLLNPRRPQALAFWCPVGSQCRLVAYMYRALGHRMPPTYGGILSWHKHGMRATWMTHVWRTKDPREGLASCAPWNALHEYLGVMYQPWKVDVEQDRACTDTVPVGGHMH